MSTKNKELQNQAETYLSDIRLYRYNSFNEYLLNLQVSTNLLSMISILEVILRNKIHKILKKHDSEYLSTKDSKLELPNQCINRIKSLSDNYFAKKYKNKKAPSIKESKKITLLPISFWYDLLTFSMWIKYLHLLFPKKVRTNVKFGSIKRKLRKIVELRNKIAHHERIISKPGFDIKKLALDITDFTMWLIEDKNHNFKTRIKEYLDEQSNKILKLIKNKY